MTICKSVSIDNQRIFNYAIDFLVDTIVDAPDFADAEDCVDFTLDMMAEETVSEADYDVLCSVKGRAALIAYAAFITTV